MDERVRYDAANVAVFLVGRAVVKAAAGSRRLLRQKGIRSAMLIVAEHQRMNTTEAVIAGADRAVPLLFHMGRE